MKVAFSIPMDNSLAELQRRFYVDPNNKQALNALIRGLAGVGKIGEAYNLLFDLGLVDKNEPLARELGIRIAEEEEAARDKKLGQASQFAVSWQPHGATRAWSYMSLQSLRPKRRPVLAVTHDGRKGTSKTLLKNLGGFPALRTLYFDQSRRLRTEDLLSIPSLPTLRHLYLKGVNVSDPTEAHRREAFKHLLTLAPLTSLKTYHSKLTKGIEALCVHCPTLRALDLTFSKNIGKLHFLTRLPNLEFLSLSFSPIKAKLLPKKLDKLRFLDFSWVIDSGECLEKLNLPSLENLCLENGKLTGRHIRAVAKFSKLKTLELSSNKTLTSQDLKPLAGLKNLEQLSLRACAGLDEETLNIARDLPQLRSLDIRGSLDFREAVKRLKDRPDIELLSGSTNSFYDHWRWKPRAWAQCSGRP